LTIATACSTRSSTSKPNVTTLGPGIGIMSSRGGGGLPSLPVPVISIR
jgi:hypothetical protein